MNKNFKSLTLYNNVISSLIEQSLALNRELLLTNLVLKFCIPLSISENKLLKFQPTSSLLPRK